MVDEIDFGVDEDFCRKDMATDQSTIGDSVHHEPENTILWNEEDDFARRKISLSELVKCIGNERRMLSTDVPPELERRVRDFRLAQLKRRDKYGKTKRWGIFGMYAHLSHVRVDLEWAEDAAWRRQNNQPYLSWTDFDDAKLQSLRRPWFAYSIVTICSIMMIVVFAIDDWKMAPFSVNPMLGPYPDALIKAGARVTSLIVVDGQWFRIFSPLILHAGIIHYVINMLALGFIGAAVEQSHGFLNALVLFTVPGVGGNILSAIFLPQYISVGASGGIFGLLGACIADVVLNWKLLFLKEADEDENHVTRRNFWCVFWLLLEMLTNIMLGLVTPVIDNWTHLGGLAYGMCCALSTLPTVNVGFFGVELGSWNKMRMIFVRFFGLIFTLVLIMVTTIWLATSTPGETPCSGCRYISCVPFPFFQQEKWWYCDDCDFVSGDLYMNENNEYYVKVDLTCPDKTVIDIDVSANHIKQFNAMKKSLPTLCRQHCKSRFS